MGRSLASSQGDYGSRRSTTIRIQVTAAQGSPCRTQTARGQVGQGHQVPRGSARSSAPTLEYCATSLSALGSGSNISDVGAGAGHLSKLPRDRGAGHVDGIQPAMPPKEA